MSSVNIFKIKNELQAFGVEFSETDSVQELKEKFSHLPITDGQIDHLERSGVRYESEWNWTRGEATEFIKKTDEYLKLRNALPIAPEQRIILMNKGVAFSEDITSGEASELIYNLPAEAEQIRYIEKYGLKVNESVPLTYGYCQRIIRKRETFLSKSRLDLVKSEV